MPETNTTIERENTQENQIMQEPTVMEEHDVTNAAAQADERERASETPEAQEQQESPASRQIPLNVRISSLELEGDTRAFATAEYGELTIRRIRVKEDLYGSLFVAMPKFRQTTGYTETCFFNTPESQEHFQSAVLEAYHQTLEQMRAQRPEQTFTDDMQYDQDDGIEYDEAEQDDGLTMEM